jgi:hypothetical protein
VQAVLVFCFFLISFQIIALSGRSKYVYHENLRRRRKKLCSKDRLPFHDVNPSYELPPQDFSGYWGGACKY